MIFFLSEWSVHSEVWELGYRWSLFSNCSLNFCTVSASWETLSLVLICFKNFLVSILTNHLVSKSFIFLNGGNWIFIEKTDAEAPIVWPHDAKSWLAGKDADAGKDGGQEAKGVTEDEVAGWHHRLNGHELEQTPRNSEGQGSLVCCGPWGRKESDMTEWLNRTEYTGINALTQ